MDLATYLLEMLTQPAVDGAGSLVELQLRIYWHGGGGAGVGVKKT